MNDTSRAKALRDEIRFKKRQKKDEERLDRINLLTSSLQCRISFAMVACTISCAAAWLLVYWHESDFKPYDKLIWIFAGCMSMFVCCTATCFNCTVGTEAKKEPVGMYYFVAAIVFFGFNSLMISCFGLVIMKFNKEIPFSDVTTILKDVLVYTYFGGGVAGFVFLLCTGFSGMEIRTLSKENYVRKLQPQWCPEVKRDMGELEEQAKRRALKKIEDLPQSNMYEDDFAKYHQSFTGVLDLQRGRTEDNDDEGYFPMADLVVCLPSHIPPNDRARAIEGARSVDKTVEFHAELRTRPCVGRLLPSMAKQFRIDPIFRNVWGTSLALALLRYKLPEWVEESPDAAKYVRSGLTPEEAVRLFEGTVTTTTQKQMEEFEWDEQEAVQDQVALNIAEAEASKSKSALKMPWVAQIEGAVTFLNATLNKLKKEKYDELCSNANDWMIVAQIVVRLGLGD